VLTIPRLAGLINVDLLLDFCVASLTHIQYIAVLWIGICRFPLYFRGPEHSIIKGKKVRNLRIRNKSFGPGFGSGFKTGFETGSETGSETFISVPDRIWIKTFKRIGSRIRIITFDI
jgi:hypothetical protein